MSVELYEAEEGLTSIVELYSSLFPDLNPYGMPYFNPKEAINPNKNKKIFESFLAGLLGAESYYPFHEGSHLGMARILDSVPGINTYSNWEKSNLGDTALVELLEKYKYLPNNDTLANPSQIYTNPSSVINNTGLGYAYVGSDNKLADWLILAGGHLGVLTAAGLFGYLGRKTNNFFLKAYSSLLSIAPTAQIIRDYLLKHPTSDLYRLSQETGLGMEPIAAGIASLSVLLLGYNWIPTVKELWDNRKLKKEDKKIIENLLTTKDKDIKKWIAESYKNKVVMG